MKTTRQLKEKYSYISKIDGKWNGYFKVGCQSFCIVEGTTKLRALWFTRMLSIALERIISDELTGKAE